MANPKSLDSNGRSRPIGGRPGNEAREARTGKTKGSRRRRLKGRDGRGRWVAGYSGNPYGRLLKELELPKPLDELIAEKLWQSVPIKGADGKKRKVSAYEQIIEGLVDSLATAKPRVKMQILE